MGALSLAAVARDRTAARRIAASRAGTYATALRRCADDMTHAGQRPTDCRATSLLLASRFEAAEAAERLDAAIVSRRGWRNPLPVQRAALSVADLDKLPAPDALRGWASRWDAYATHIDP